LLVEGGATLLQHFINEHLWDEASVITNTSLSAHQGTAAPVLQNASVVSTQNIRNDRIQIFRPLKK
jgi:riboflavin biosynthesis pyrimidine reductase